MPWDVPIRSNDCNLHYYCRPGAMNLRRLPLRSLQRPAFCGAIGVLASALPRRFCPRSKRSTPHCLPVTANGRDSKTPDTTAAAAAVSRHPPLITHNNVSIAHHPPCIMHSACMSHRHRFALSQRHGGGAGCQYRYSGIRHRSDQRRRGRGRRKSTDRCALENRLTGKAAWGTAIWRTVKSRADASPWVGGAASLVVRGIECRGCCSFSSCLRVRCCVSESCTTVRTRRR